MVSMLLANIIIIYSTTATTTCAIMKERLTIDSIVKGLETGLINTFPADSPLCTVDNIFDSFHGCF